MPHLIELFHCGPDKAVRTVALEGDRVTPWAITQALAGSPHFNVETNPDADKAIHDLTHQREASLGWCRLWIVPSIGDRVEMDLHAIGGRVDTVTGTCVEWQVYGDGTRTTPSPVIQTEAHGRVVWSVSSTAAKRVLSDG